MNNNISFGASLKTNTFIRKGRMHTPVSVSIVELDKTNANDMNALSTISDSWNKEGSKNCRFNNYVDMILTKAGSEENDFSVKDHYLALTTQKDNFEKLDPKNVLGVSLFSEDGVGGELEYLQVHPNTCKSYAGSKRVYKNVGTAMIDYLKDTYSKVHIFVNAAHDAVKFYYKNGFVPYNKSYSWYLHLPQNK
ncbi:MAG: hypothetical protein SPL76_03805 [Cyanobacteriota bacterium]|nr:hypothetical protein [Cyanobacteriota bacterium]